MLNAIDLNILKEKYKDEKIIYVNFRNKIEFVFKALAVQDYNKIISVLSNEKDIEDAICQSCLIYPNTDSYNISECPYAGVVEKSCEIIKAYSGIFNPNDVMSHIDIYRNQMEDFYEQCRNLIKAAFYNEFSYEEMEEWSWYKLIKYAVRAETILKYRNSDGIELTIKEKEDNAEGDIENNIKEDTEEIIKEMRKEGIDPMLYYHKGDSNTGNEIIDFPLIGSIHWQRSDILDGIRKQIDKSSL